MNARVVVLGFTVAILAPHQAPGLIDGAQAQTAPPPKPGLPKIELAPGAAVRVSEEGLRQAARVTVPPTYPPESLAAKVSGVAVAGVLVAADGRVERVEILESPDALTGEAVQRAVMAWMFTPLQVAGANSPARMQGKLTFYFELSGKTGRVLSPEQIGPSKSREGDFGSSREISEAALGKLSAEAMPLVVDIRDRAAFQKSHRAGVLNVPFDELETRSRELRHRNGVALDCTQVSMDRCRHAASSLVDRGIPKVFLLVK